MIVGKKTEMIATGSEEPRREVCLQCDHSFLAKLLGLLVEWYFECDACRTTEEVRLFNIVN